MKALPAIFAVAALAAAQSAGITSRTVWFEDGTALDFSTRTTGSTAISTEGSLVASVFNGIHRVVLDKDGKLLFVYGVEAWRDALPQTFFIRIKPVDRDLELERAAGMPWLFGKATHPFPTVAAVREFPGVRLGDAILLDILQNPATGEKIFDVISPIESSAARSAPGDSFRVANARVVVNGQTMRVTGDGAAAGAALAIRLPAKGSYYLATHSSTQYSFQPAGKVEHDRLTLKLDGDTISILGSGDLLRNSAYSTVWVYHDPGQNRQFVSLERKIQQLKLALAALRNTYTDNHPSVASTRTALEALEYQRDRRIESVTLEAAPSLEELMKKEKP